MVCGTVHQRKILFDPYPPNPPTLSSSLILHPFLLLFVLVMYMFERVETNGRKKHERKEFKGVRVQDLEEGVFTLCCLCLMSLKMPSVTSNSDV